MLFLDRTAPSPDDSAPSSAPGGRGSTSSPALSPTSPRRGGAPPGVLDEVPGGRGAGGGLGEAGRSSSNLAISGSHLYLAGGAGGKEPTPSIASDISNPYAVQELQQRLHQLHK